jgi:hypothetical protein
MTRSAPPNKNQDSQRWASLSRRVERQSPGVAEVRRWTARGAAHGRLKLYENGWPGCLCIGIRFAI